MDPFIWLIFAHFIGDWALQNEWMAQNKKIYFYVMLAHCMIWTACICVAAEYIGVYDPIQIPFLVLGHYMVDKWKCKESKGLDSWHLYADQLWHILQIYIIYCWWD